MALCSAEPDPWAAWPEEPDPAESGPLKTTAPAKAKSFVEPDPVKTDPAKPDSEKLHSAELAPAPRTAAPAAPTGPQTPNLAIVDSGNPPRIGSARAENTLKCKECEAEGQSGVGVVYTDGKMLPPPPNPSILTLDRAPVCLKHRDSGASELCSVLNQLPAGSAE